LVCRPAGFTLIEVAVVVIVAATLMTVALQRLARYQELAERAAMESTLRLVKTGLQIRLAELIIENRQAEAAVLEQENPMQWLAERPQNYQGEYRRPLQRGAWYYEKRHGELVYVANNAASLEADFEDGVKEVRFRARLLKDVVKFGGATIESVTGITLVPVKPYFWPRSRADESVA